MRVLVQGEGANEKKAYISDDIPCVDGLIRNDHSVEQNEEHDLRKYSVSDEQRENGGENEWGLGRGSVVLNRGSAGRADQGSQTRVYPE